MVSMSILLPLVLVAWVSGSLSVPAQPAEPASDSVRVGTIEGRLEMRPTPARRRVDRYLGAAGHAPSTVQPIAPVVFLRGRFPGITAPAGRIRLEQRDTTFTPAVVIVGVGGTVEFPNGDPFFHNVFSYSPAQRFDLGRYPQGESKAVRFDDPGIVRIYCEVHDTMRSAVIVVENPFHAIVDDQGAFVIRDVPAGRWELEVWHPDLEGGIQTITIETGQTTRLTIPLQ